jgi:hypothetical protein
MGGKSGKNGEATAVRNGRRQEDKVRSSADIKQDEASEPKTKLFTVKNVLAASSRLQNTGYCCSWH